MPKRLNISLSNFNPIDVDEKFIHCLGAAVYSQGNDRCYVFRLIVRRCDRCGLIVFNAYGTSTPEDARTAAENALRELAFAQGEAVVGVCQHFGIFRTLVRPRTVLKNHPTQSTIQNCSYPDKQTFSFYNCNFHLFIYYFFSLKINNETKSLPGAHHRKMITCKNL